MEELFPHKLGVDYNRLQMTPEGLYSVTRRRDGQRMMDILKDTIPNIHKKRITDATACVGSDTLRFSMEFAHVDAIEWKHDNVVVLRHNLDVFGGANVRIHEGDATKLFKWKTDVLYIDPPWGGPEYYKTAKLDVYLGPTRLDNWIESVLKRTDRPEYIVLKLPRNYNFAHIQFLPSVNKTLIHRIRNFILVILI
mgnify:CR=1 FL=1